MLGKLSMIVGVFLLTVIVGVGLKLNPASCGFGCCGVILILGSFLDAIGGRR